jgi:hypothetical protein
MPVKEKMRARLAPNHRLMIFSFGRYLGRAEVRIGKAVKIPSARCLKLRTIDFGAGPTAQCRQEQGAGIKTANRVAPRWGRGPARTTLRFLVPDRIPTAHCRPG